MFKEIVKKSLKFIGIKVTRIGFKGNPADKYFNSGKLSSIEENSSELYDKFYSDHKVLDKYYDKDRLEFYKNVAGNLQKEGVSLKNKTVLDMGTGVGYLLDEIVKIFNEHINGYKNHQMFLWQFINLELWFNKFFDEL